MAFSTLGTKLLYAWQIAVTTILLIISWVASWFYKKKEIWLFRERGTDARDNGYWMFRYIKKHHPKIEAYYAITKDSPDRKRLEPWQDCIIEQNSFRHFIYMWRATHMLSTHICGGYPNMVRGVKWLYYFVTWLSPKKTIWLQHGVLLNDLKIYASRYNNLDMIVCSAVPEHDQLCNIYGYSNKVVQLTGLARYDQLFDYEVNKNQILFMPTWRKWLNSKNFAKSEYFNTIAEFLKMPQLHSLLEANKLTLLFYPHHEIQPYLHYFKALSLPRSIQIADKEHNDVQQLLKESALLITDYSSLSMDFAYMHKPLIYFLFDEERFRTEHYAASQFNYHDGFGPYATNKKELLDLAKQFIDSNMKMESKYIQKAKEFFPYRDTTYCERIYHAISKI